MSLRSGKNFQRQKVMAEIERAASENACIGDCGRTSEASDGGAEAQSSGGTETSRQGADRKRSGVEAKRRGGAKTFRTRASY